MAESPAFTTGVWMRRHWQVWIPAVAVLAIVWLVYWVATAEDRTERKAVEQLRREANLGNFLSGSPKVVELMDHTWVGEVIWDDRPQWDYVATGSKAFPFRGFTIIKLERWITTPYATKEKAKEAAGRREGLFEVGFRELRPGVLSYPAFSESQRSLVPRFVVRDMRYDSQKGTWIMAGTAIELSTERACEEWKEKWFRNQGSRQSFSEDGRYGN